MIESCARLVFNCEEGLPAMSSKQGSTFGTRGQMATGQKARTGRPEAVLQCSLGLQRQL